MPCCPPLGREAESMPIRRAEQPSEEAKAARLRTTQLLVHVSLVGSEHSGVVISAAIEAYSAWELSRPSEREYRAALFRELRDPVMDHLQYDIARLCRPVGDPPPMI